MPELPTDRIEQFLREHPGLPTPFLVIDLDVVAERYRMLCEALPRAAVYYAVKANPDPAVVRLLVDLRCDFDVASPAEVELCLDHGARADQLSYGNTVKKEADILRAAGRGVTTFALDCAQELHKLIRSAPGSVAMVRLAVDGAGADWPLSRKFGCGPQDALTLLRSAAAARHPVGIGFQVGSQQHDPDAWDAPLAQVAVLAEALAADGVRLTAVNLGGGLPSLHADPTPGLDRFLVGDAGLLRAEVVLTSRRDSDPGRRWVYLDVGMFSGLVETAEEAIRYRIRVPRRHGPTEPAVLAGPTCDSLDVLYERRPYPLPVDLRAGDRVDLLSTGAYTTSYSSVGFNGFEPLRAYHLPPSSPSPIGTGTIESLATSALTDGAAAPGS